MENTVKIQEWEGKTWFFGQPVGDGGTKWWQGQAYDWLFLNSIL